MKNTRSALVLFIVVLNFIPTLAHATALSDLTAATAANTINNGSNRQEWDWNTLGGGTGLYLASNATGAGNGQIVLSVQQSSQFSASGSTSYGIMFTGGHWGTNSTNYGVYSTVGGSEVTNSYAIYGLTIGTSAGNTGVWGDASNSGGASTGATYGVYGTNASATGYAGYFNNSNGGYAAAFMGGKVGIGTATPQSLVHAYGGEVQVGSSGASCAAARGGAIRFSGSTLYYCDGTSTWQTVGGGGGSGTVTSSTAGQVAYYQSTGATVIGTSTLNVVSGNVGVNTTNPGLLFTVDQSSGSAASDANAGQVLIRGFGGGGKAYSGLRFAMHEHSTGWGSDIQGFDDTSSYGGALVFRTGTGSATGTPSERMRIASSGNVGIGLTSPSYTLQVNGSVAGTSAYVNTSDLRFKKNVQPLNIGLSIVEQLKPVTFEWKDEVRSVGIGTARPQMSLGKDHRPFDSAMQGKQMGFIAQDVEKILPSVVVTQPDAEKTKGMKYSELIPVLTKAIQELKADNDNLHREVAELKSEVETRKH